MTKEIDHQLYRKKIDALDCCVIIPTYNNEQTIVQVITDVLAFTEHIIVVNDGATDSTATLISRFSQIEIISYQPNRGKGWALRTGIKKAQEKGYRYAITIDSDGQHYADDIPVFIDKIEENPGALIIGARNLNQENMPKKNTFGNKFSNFWFYLFTGINLPDTQSGYRLYPVDKMKHLKYFTSKYEFEIEVMVKAAWKNIPVLSVPIRVFYAEGDKRITHFRPGRDFTRISLLNTYLFFPAVLWYKPVKFIRNFTVKNIKAFMRKHFLDPNEPVIKKSVGVAFGVFMGIIPIWGYQFVAALILAHFLKLNKAIVGVAANISVPPMIPFLLYGSLKTGQLVLQKDLTDNIFNKEITFDTIKIHIVEYIVGSFVFATIMALILGASTYLILKLINNKALSKTAKQA
ncbi:MAG: DUF2062 domain-containing protein [Bacteroidota bacterium]|nr:DUF2062 domain-containing protein [Bacteroidota bacterium]